MNPVEVVSALAATGGIIGAIIAVFKLSPERQNIFITTAQGAVVVQSGVIDDLRDEIGHLRDRIDGYSALEQDMTSLHAELATVQDRLAKTALERDRLKLENERLTERVAVLEGEVDQLKTGST